MNRASHIDYIYVTQKRLNVISEMLQKEGVPIGIKVWECIESRNAGDAYHYSTSDHNLSAIISKLRHSYGKGGCVEIIADWDTGCIYHCDDYCSYLYYSTILDLGLTLDITEADRLLDEMLKSPIL